jgi:adiponectin receptor
MLCLLTSTISHLLCCHSSTLSSILWRCDYAGISAMIATSFFPPVYYTFMCNPQLRDFYLGSITILGILMLLVTSSPRLQRNNYRILRTLLFCGMGFCGMIPCIHKVMTHSAEEAAFSTTKFEIIMGIFYGLGSLFYATRIPERWMPGSFDIAGHSHQIFHILVVCGAYMHYKAALLYIEWRDTHGCD